MSNESEWNADTDERFTDYQRRWANLQPSPPIAYAHSVMRSLRAEETAHPTKGAAMSR